jgi:hypothetical protein
MWSYNFSPLYVTNVRSLKFDFAQGFTPVTSCRVGKPLRHFRKKVRSMFLIGTLGAVSLMHDRLPGVALQIYERFKQGLLNYTASVGAVTRSLIGAARKEYTTLR